jgi:hypothetical protein
LFWDGKLAIVIHTYSYFTHKTFFPHTMTTINSMELNERACFLLSQGSVSEGLHLFKLALSALKNEIKELSTDLNLSDAHTRPLYQEHDGTAGTTGAFFGWLLPAPEACKGECERFWIYSQPLSMQRITNSSACDKWSNHSDAFTVSFNVALASHLQGMEQEVGGDSNAASHSFMVAMNMYYLTLRQCQTNHTRNRAIFNTLNDHVYAAIFSNLAHVHVMLGEPYRSTAVAEQLLKTLFYLVDSGRMTSVREVSIHQLLLENAYCLLIASSNSAAAA